MSGSRTQDVTLLPFQEELGQHSLRCLRDRGSWHLEKPVKRPRAASQVRTKRLDLLPPFQKRCARLMSYMAYEKQEGKMPWPCPPTTKIVKCGPSFWLLRLLSRGAQESRGYHACVLESSRARNHKRSGGSQSREKKMLLVG